MLPANPERKLLDRYHRFRKTGSRMLGQGGQNHRLISSRRRSHGAGNGNRDLSCRHNPRSWRSYPRQLQGGRRNRGHCPGHGRRGDNRATGQLRFNPCAQTHLQTKSIVGCAEALEKGGHVRNEDLGSLQDEVVEVFRCQHLAFRHFQGLRGGGSGSLIHHGHLPEDVPFAQLGQNHRFSLRKEANLHPTS